MVLRWSIDNTLDPGEMLLLRLWNWKVKYNIIDAAFDGLQDVFPDSGLPSFKTAKTKMRNLSGFEPQTYDCCIKSCLCYVGVNEDLEACPYCKEDRWRNGKPRNVFHYLPIIPRLQAFYANARLTEQMRYRHNLEEQEGVIRDIFDGVMYRSLKETLVTIGGHQQDYTFFNSETDVALGLFADGFAPFKNRKHTCWPIVFTNLNLPPEVRTLFENLICAGVIPGPHKPKDFDSFLYPMMLEGVDLAIGVETHHCIYNLQFDLRGYLMVVGGDMPAVAMMMKMKGHGSRCPCRMCKMIALLAANGKTYYMPHITPESRIDDRESYDVANLPLRTPASFMEEAIEVDSAVMEAEAEELAKACGIKGVPILSHLPSLVFPYSFPLDFMHLMYENTIKNIINFFSGSFKDLDHDEEGYFVEPTVWTAIGEATAETGSTIPGAFGARPRDFVENRTGVTADMFSFWTLYLGPVYLEKAIAPQFYNHFVQLVRLINLCLEFEITQEQLQEIRTGFQKWVSEYERSESISQRSRGTADVPAAFYRLYYQYADDRLSACPVTIHSLLHIADGIEYMGPVWVYWAFAMERFCGKMARNIKSRRFPYANLDNRILTQAQLTCVLQRYNLDDTLNPPKDEDAGIIIENPNCKSRVWQVNACVH